MPESRRLQAAIVGLGQVGLRFDLESKRKLSEEIWTHFSAYEHLEHLYDLKWAVEPDELKHKAALERMPEIVIYKSIPEMLDHEEVDVVSICTPDETHLDCLEQVLGKVRGVFIEKPVCRIEEVERARRLADRLKEAGMSIRVNYYKQQEPMVIECINYLKNDTILNLTCKYSGPFDAVGSHALNLLLYFMPDLKPVHSIRHVAEEGDGFSAFLMGSQFKTGQLLYCGLRHNLIFEMEILTKSGRITLGENLASLSIEQYKPSNRYEGYRELAFKETKTLSGNQCRFVASLTELAKELKDDMKCWENLKNAMSTQDLMMFIRDQTQK